MLCLSAPTRTTLSPRKREDHQVKIHAISAVVVAVAAAAVQADTVNLQFVGVGASRSIKAYIGASTFNVSAGQLRHTFSGGTGVAAGLTGTKTTFCTDLTEYVTGSGATYTVAPIANLPQTSGWPAMGAARAQAVYNLYAAAGGAQYGVSNDYAAAFQIALWEVVYDFSGTLASLNLTSGNFRAGDTDGSSLSAAIAAQVTTLFNAIVGPNASQTGLMGLTRAGAQDQIVQTDVVPIPAGAFIGMAGLGLAAFVRSRGRGR